uniref:KIF21A/B second helical domain-containing protein n=1 Tax=Ditylenchus dipsaci TaxID=166011 RepID=A0A915E6G2_9BILA
MSYFTRHLDENDPEADEQASLTSLADQCSNVMDAKYIILRLLNMVVDKGVATCKAQYEKKELNARIQQLQKESKISEQLMSQLIESDKSITFDIHDIVEARKSATPPDEKHRFVAPSSFSLQGESTTSTNSACSLVFPPAPEKVRRRTATTEELLYVSKLLETPTKQSMESLKAIPEGNGKCFCRVCGGLSCEYISRRRWRRLYGESAHLHNNIDDAMKKSTNSSNLCDEEELSSQADAPPSSRSTKRRISEITRYVPLTMLNLLPSVVCCVEATQQMVIQGELIACMPARHTFSVGLGQNSKTVGLGEVPGGGHLQGHMNTSTLSIYCPKTAT